MMSSRPIGFKALVLMLLAYFPLTAGWANTTHSNLENAVLQSSAHTLEQTNDDTPTWQDLGLRDLLAAASQNVVEAPHTFASGNGNQGGGHSSQAGSPTLTCRHHTLLVASRKSCLALALPTRASDYYIYFLYRLRL